MSDPSGSQAAGTPEDVPDPGVREMSPDAEQEGWAPAGQAQPSPAQPYDVPSGAQQYGQPPATGYQPPDTDQPGRWAAVQGGGPQQYGQPGHGQASYAQEGFPAPGTGPGGYQPPTPGYGQPPVTGAPGYGTPAQGFFPQAAPYEQQPYGSQQPYPGQPYAPQAQSPFPGQGYPSQPYVAQPPAALSANDQRLWATLTHLSIPFLGFVGPLVAYLVLKDRSPFLKDSTTEALNFSILFSIALTVSSILAAVLIGAVLLPVVWVVGIVFCILAAVRANRGEVYRYPLSWRLVK